MNKRTLSNILVTLATMALITIIGYGLYDLGYAAEYTGLVKEVEILEAVNVSNEAEIHSLQGELRQWEKCIAERAAEEKVKAAPMFTEQVQTSLKGVVHIMCPKWQGSGFVVGPRLIVTARHVVEGVEDFDITTWDGHHIHATKAISDKKHDVAFIWVDDLTCTLEKDREIECQRVQHGVKLQPLEVGSIKECALGQNVYVIGSPYGKVNFNALSVGIISGVNRDWSPLGDDYGWNVAFTVDSAGHPGNSGCPVFTTDGVVRGILVGGFSPVLISVMPCDLFLEDLGMIQLMFVLDRYEHEVAVAEPVWGYGYVVESEDVGVEGHK